MKYVLIHSEADRPEAALVERYFLYSTEEERDAQLEHDKEFFPGKTMWTAEADDDDVVNEETRVEA